MEINWSTFVLEIINFLVLLWLLKRFLYRPVLGAIERRRAAVSERLEEAQRLRAEAGELRGSYQNRLQDWQRERQQAREQLQRELDALRTREMETLHEALQQQREQAEAALAGERRDALRAVQVAALEQGGAFAARFLQPLADAALEARLVELALRQLAALPPERRRQLVAGTDTPPTEIRVSSAWPLSEAQRRELKNELAQTTGLDVPIAFARDKALLAGLRIEIGAWAIGANLRDELQAFARWSEHGD